MVGLFDYFRQIGVSVGQYATSQGYATGQYLARQGRQQNLQPPVPPPPAVQTPPKPRPVEPERPSAYFTGGIYTAGVGVGEWLQGVIPSESKIAIGARKVLPTPLIAPMTQFALFGRGAATSPGEMIRFFAAAPLGMEYAIRKPSAAAEAIVPAISSTITGTIEFAKAHPAEFAGQMAGQFLISYGIETGIPKLYRGLQPRITEVRAIAGSPAEQWGAIHGTTSLYTKLRGIESRIALEPGLSEVVGVGIKGPELTEYISEYPHSIYGRTTEIGQMPKSLIESRGFTYDVDIFVQGEKQFRIGAEKIVKPGVLDIHPFPEKYPIGIAEEPVTPYPPKQAYFSYLPESVSDLLIGEKLTQEKLYIQAGRKATSVIGEPSGFISWKYGPEAWRLKDVADLMRYGTYLKGELEAEVATSSRLNLPLQIGGRLRVAGIQRGLSSLGEYWGKEAATGKYLESEIYGPMIRKMGRGESVSLGMLAGVRELPEIQFAIPKGYKLPVAGEIPRPYVIMSPRTSFGIIPSVSGSVGFSPSRISSVASGVSLGEISGAPPSRPSKAPPSGPRLIIPSRSPIMSYIPKPPSPTRSSPPSRPPYIPSLLPPYKPPSMTPPITPPTIYPLSRKFKREESDIFWRKKTRPIFPFKYRVFQKVLDPRKVFTFKLKGSKVRI